MRKLRLIVIPRSSKRKKEGRGVRQQINACRVCAQANGYEIVDVIDSGRSESGKTMDRDALHRAKEMIRNDLADGVMTTVVDRLGRAPIEEMMSYVRELYTLGGVFVPADAGGRPIDLNDPMAETNFVMQAQFGRQYWLTRATGALKTRTEAVAEGKYVAAAPRGFDKSRGRLVPNADADVMRAAFKAAGSGSLRPAQAVLRSRWPHERWDADRVRKLLASPAYKGWSVSGSLVNREAHVAIVSEADWDAAQVEARSRRTNGRYPLSGIATTPDGEPLVAQLQTVRERTYRRLRAPGCSIDATALEDHVRRVLTAELGDSEFRARFVPGDIEAARRDHARALDELKAYVVRADALDAEIFDAGLAPRKARVAETKATLSELTDVTARFEALPAAEDLSFDRDDLGHPADANGFETAVAVTVDSIVIAPGRGSVEDRAEIVWR